MNFCTYIRGVGNRIADLVPHGSSVLLSQSMDQRFNGGSAHVQLLRNLFVRRKLLAVEGVQEGFERFERGRFPLSKLFSTEPVHGFSE